MSAYVSGEIALVAGAAYPAAASPQVTCPFEPRRVLLHNMDSTTAHEMYVSFDGVNDHACVLGASTLVLKYQHGMKVWLRSPAVTGSTAAHVGFEA